MIYIDWKKFGTLVKYKLDLMGVSVGEAAKAMNLGRTRLFEIVTGTVHEQVRKKTLTKILKYIKACMLRRQAVTANYRRKGLRNFRSVRLGSEKVEKCKKMLPASRFFC